MLLKYLFILSIVFAFSADIKAQNKQNLQKEYNTIMKEIQEIEQLLSQTRNEKEASLHALQSLDKKIKSRQSLLNNIADQVSYIDDNIRDKTAIVSSMKEDIETLKASYADMVYHSYKNLHTKNKLSFVFSAESFNQAFNRFNYLRTYSSYRQNQAKQIQRTIGDIENKITELEEQKTEKQALLLEEKQQNSALQNEKASKNTILADLEDDEKKLKKDAKEKNKAALELNGKIQKIIANEIKLAKEKAAAKAAANNTTVTNSLGLTPEEKLLSSNFVSNKGMLPWPVLKGHIIERFGKRPHPTVEKIYTNNNGVDIKTEEGAEVRAIFNGTVQTVFFLPTTHNTILVKHGEYYTVYSNLKSVSVSAGDQIVTKQSLGVAYTSTDQNLTKVHLEVWQETTLSNPELWLVK